MAEDSTPSETAAEAPEVVEPKIMCYVSKEMVPLSETVEVAYDDRKTFRVLPKYIKFKSDAEASAE